MTSKFIRQPFVVAVGGTSGAGKTCLIDRAAGQLVSAATLHFDEYVTLGNDIGEIKAWVNAGANPNEVKTPMLAADLRKLILREAVHLLNGGRRIEPADFIIVEEPFGRSRLELTSIIDLAVFIDVPADIALARRLVREIETQPEGAGQLVAQIDGQLKAFLAVGRDAYLAAAQAARESADIVLDGMQPIDDLAGTLVDEIRRRA